MAYNYLELVNDVNSRLNEIPLTSSNFAGAGGYYADAKRHINASLNRINREEFEWPFNHETVTLTLTINQNKYNLPSDTKSVAWDTFRLIGDEAFNINSRRLQILDYEDYLARFTDDEEFPENHTGGPRFVVRNRDMSFTISPPPDKEYRIKYEYYKFPSELTLWNDVPTIPETFKWVIVEGAMYYAYMFRGGLEEASLSNQLFQDGVKDMRKIYINRYEYVRSPTFAYNWRGR